jgi:energy-coupling factor transporter ATP-binding protein EcfA2
MPDDQFFDAFLSYSRNDKSAVEELARRLVDEAKLKPWLDKWNLIPGEPWQEELEEALDRSHTCAVFIGPGCIGPWQNEEMRSALDTRVKKPGFRVVPVLLPGASLPERGQLPRFLSRLTWVDFRSPAGFGNKEEFLRLVAGIRGIAPGRWDEATSPTTIVECPYRGLELFDEAHARFFFGREAMTQHVVETLRPRRFLAVLGPSGSGKSSLAQAGLLSKLKTGALLGSAKWTYLVFRPGANPIEELALILARAEKSSDDLLERTKRLLSSLETDERSLHLHVRLSLGDRPKQAQFFLLIDQFEEVFTLCQNQEQRVQFINNIRYAATVAEGQTTIVVTMRADFLARAAGYTDLAELLSGHQFLVSPMNEEDLRAVIVEPARLVALSFEQGLVEKILKDVGREPGALPLLEHMLLQLCEKRRADNVMTSQAYNEIGGVQGALAKRADAIYDGLSPEQQAIMRRILLRLTQPGEGSEDTRRRAAMSELIARHEESGAAESVVQYLSDARLVTTSGDEQPEKRMVDVSHEALIRGWPRLQKWIDEDRAGLRVHRRLTEAAQEWQKQSKDESGLYHGAKLLQSIEWVKHSKPALNELEREFLTASTALKKREVGSRRRSRVLAGCLFLAFIFIVMFAMYAVQMQRRAQQAAGEAEVQRMRATEAAMEAEKQKEQAEAERMLADERTREAEAARAKQRRPR